MASSTTVLYPNDTVKGKAVETVDHASRSKINGEGGNLIADVTSPHAKKHRIVFDRTLNVFEFKLLDGSSKHLTTYRLDELLCTSKSSVPLRKGVPTASKKGANTPKTLFFYFVYKEDKLKWRLKEVPVVFNTTSERDYWHTIIDSTIRRISSHNVEAFFSMSPGLRYQVLLTERAYHARDFIVEMPVDHWSALDGLVSDSKKDTGRDIDDPNTAHLATPHLRFGIIGAGSANSIVSTVHETNDYATSAVHIAIGSECNVDVCTVHRDSKLIRISANAISYGWLGDVLRDSENYRCLGPIRYQWSALRTTIRNPTYRGTVQFTLSHKETVDPRTKMPQCIKNCPVCEKPGKESDETTQYDYHFHDEFSHVICCVIPTVTPFTPHGLAPYTGIGDGTLDLALIPKVSRFRNMQFMRRLYSSDRTLVCYRVVRWSYQPDADQEDPGVWNLDGEILEQPKGEALHFKLHPQLISFFGRDAAMINPVKRSFIKKRKSSIVYK
ncbi:unnamed protein product [Caenorhabditis auriculariae]|uniref:PH domain-containing protein n=1 Tax=Caenorhabditis auriculariae TaxID=2777116 RepID=A0A8S1GMS1_9PELO|nr:unnamed protein product [Caenorhabditis auriculariae]